MNSRIPFKLTCFTSLLLAAGQVWADVLPGAAMPEQVSRSIRSQQVTPNETLPPAIERPKPTPSPLGEQAKKIKFQLNGVILDGNRVYSTKQLEPLYASDLHKTISVADLFDIVQNITNYYRNNGYILSRAILPPQHVKGGVVKIKIIEGYIDKVTVTGNPHGAKCAILAFGNKLKECRPLQVSRMERYLLIANDTAGTDVKAVLSPSKTQIGAADLTLVTQNIPVQGYLSYDDYGTRYIGPQQMTANLQLNSFIRSGDSLLTTFTKTPKGRELTYLDVNYTSLMNTEGVKWLVGVTRAETNPLFVLTEQEISGLNLNYYTTVYIPYIRTRSQSLTWRVGFNYQDSGVNTLFDQTLYNDHLRSLDLGMTFNFSDTWYGSNMLSADFRQGLPILGYSSDYNPDTAQTSRPGGRGDYTKLAASLNRLQAIRNSNFSLYGAVNGQWAANPLLSSEQFTFGGSQIGRGYDVAELIGDRGFDGSVEIRYDWNLAKFYIQTIQFYGFYDAGVIWNLKTSPGSPAKQSGTSTGLGFRFFMTKYLSGNFMWTQTITKQVAAEQLIGNGALPRTFFSVVGTFG